MSLVHPFQLPLYFLFYSNHVNKSFHAKRAAKASPPNNLLHHTKRQHHRKRFLARRPKMEESDADDQDAGGLAADAVGKGYEYFA